MSETQSDNPSSVAETTVAAAVEAGRYEAATAAHEAQAAVSRVSAENAATEAQEAAEAVTAVTAQMLAETEARLEGMFGAIGEQMTTHAARIDALEAAINRTVSETQVTAKETGETTEEVVEIPKETVQEAEEVIKKLRRYRKL